MIRKQKAKIKDPSTEKRYRRKLTIRKKVSGSAVRPRIVPSKGNRNLYVQVIDDESGKTLLSVQSFGKNAVNKSGATVDGAKVLGSSLAEKMKSANLERAVFDRSGYKYHGVIKSLADAIRENGVSI